MWVDRVLEAISIFGLVFGAGVMFGAEIGRRNERQRQQFNRLWRHYDDR